MGDARAGPSRARWSRSRRKRILTGADPEKAGSRDSPANPEALDLLVGLSGSDA
jgi:hypothetical protein